MAILALKPQRNDSRDLAKEILRRQEKLRTTRTNWESHWQEIADRVLPRQADFNITRAEGQKRTEYIFDATACLAAERCTAALDAILTPASSKWHTLKLIDEDLNDDPKWSGWLDEVNDILWRWRYSPKANFSNNISETYMGLTCFGTASLFIEGAMHKGLRYSSNFLGNLFIAENQQGMVDTVHNMVEYSARQAAQKWGAGNLPKAVYNKLDQSPDEKFKFLHCVTPREDVAYGNKTFRGMPWTSYWVAVDQGEMVGEGGYWTWPYPTSRYSKAPHETYGRSPAMTVLPEIKMTQEMSKSMIRQVNRAADPVLLAHDDGVLQKISTRPGAINRGGVNEAGQPLIHAMDFGANFQVADQELANRRNMINTAFLVTLFQIAVERPNMTATEAMIRAQEKGAMIAPLAGRQQSELLDPTLEREIDILSRMGVLPPPPEDMGEQGIDLKVEYETPMLRAMQSQEVAAFSRTIEALAPLAQIDPTVTDIFDPMVAARGLAGANGVPQKWLRSDEEIKALADGRAQAAQAQQLLAAAPVATDSALKLAQAQALQGQ